MDRLTPSDIFGQAMTRRQLLAGTGVAAGTVALGRKLTLPRQSTPAASPAAGPPLRELAAKKGFEIGAAAWQRTLAIDQQYRAVLAREFNLLHTETILWDQLVPEGPGRFLWDFTDAAVDFARQHGMHVEAQHLAWGNPDNLPDWLKDPVAGYQGQKLLTVLRNHVQSVVGRYKGRIAQWSVVNEPFEADGSYKSDPTRWSWWNINSPWSDGVDPDYIELAFRTANQADPKAILYLNEWGAEEMNPKADAVYNLVSRLRAKQVPIHAVGMEMHLHAEHPLDKESVVANMQRLHEDLGMDVLITEFTVSLSKIEGTDDEKFQVQANMYRDMFDALVESGAGNSFAIFGVSDDGYETDETGNPYPQPTILDEFYQPKPAYYALQRELESLPDKGAAPAGATQSGGTFKIGATVTVTATGVNLRAQPSTSAVVVATLNAGDRLTITGAPTTADGYTWYPVKAANGAQGYVAGTFLQKG